MYALNWPGETKYSLIGDILCFIGKTVINVVTSSYLSIVNDVKGYANASNSFLRARQTAKTCGKFLAHLICSRKFYKLQTINLVGFSLGSQVIKSCIKEIYNLSQRDKSYRNIVQNVVFVAGATQFNNMSKWREIFDRVVAGRVINCYGKNDNILKFLFKIATLNRAIGEFPIGVGDCDGKGDGSSGEGFGIKSEKVEDFDFSDLAIDHHEYRKSMHKILRRINL